MPYGRMSRYGSRARMRRPTGKRVARKKVAVPKKKRTARTYTRNNARAINSLSRDVQFLKRARHGSIQQNLQTTDGSPMFPTKSYPILTDLTDFTCYRAATTTPPVPQRDGARFYQYSPTGLQTTGIYTIDNFSNSPYWVNQNKDTVDTGKYMPVMAKYTIRIEGRNSLDNTRVRIQVFQAKSSAIIPFNNSGVTSLPSGLTYLGDMADPTLNRLNPVFFKEYKALGKTIFINSTKTDSQTKGTTGNIFYHYFTIRPKKMKYQTLTVPNTPNDPSDAPTEGAFGPLEISPDSPLWMLVSTDDDVGQPNQAVSVRVSRRCVWRDPIGSSAITP